MSAQPRIDRNRDPGEEPNIDKADEGVIAGEKKGNENPERRSAFEKLRGYLSREKKEAEGALDELDKIAKGEIGSEGSVKIVPAEAAAVGAMEKDVEKAFDATRIKKLLNDRDGDLNILNAFWKESLEKDKKETTEKDLELYRGLVKRGSLQEKDTGKYSKVNAEEQAHLSRLEGPFITREVLAKMSQGEIPWTTNGIFAAIGLVRDGYSPLTGKRYEIRGESSVKADKKLTAAGLAVAAGAGAVVGSMIAGANPDRDRSEPRPDEPKVDVAMDDAELDPLRVETEARLKKADEDEKKLIKELENIEEQLAECREYEYQKGEKNPDRLKFLESHLDFFPPFDPDRKNSKDPVIIVMDDETYLNKIFKPNFDRLPVGAKLVTLERLLIKAKDALSKNKAICETNIERVRAERERIKKELESIPKTTPKKPKQPAVASGGEIKEPKPDAIAGDDELSAKAQAILIKEGKISSSLLQRTFDIGFQRAQKLLDLIEKKGLIGPQIGTEPRKLLTKTPAGAPKGPTAPVGGEAKPDAGEGEKETAKIMEAAREAIKTRTADLGKRELEDLVETREEIADTAPGEIKNALIKGKYLSADQAEKLDQEALFTLRFELAAAYAKTIESKEKDPRQMTLHELEQYLIKAGDRAYDTVTADRTDDLNAEIKKIKGFDRGEYRHHLDIIKQPGVDVALLNDDDLGRLRDVEIAKKMLTWGKAKELLAKKKPDDKPKTGTPKSGAETAIAAAPDKPPEPPKQPEKGECLGIATRFLGERAAKLEAGLEGVDQKQLIEAREWLETAATAAFRKYLTEAGLDSAIADGLNDVELEGLLSIEKIHVDNLIAQKNPKKGPSLTGSLAEIAHANGESKKKKNKRERKKKE